MKEIKFRAWGDKSKVMIDDGILTKWQLEELRDGRYILMQFTGLKDKNGKEIYEGDIVQDHCQGAALPEAERDNIGKVYQGKSGMWLWTRPNNEIDQFGGGENLLYVLEFNEAEVIGNIYENPELLHTIGGE